MNGRDRRRGNVLTIIKKELARLFGDRRMLLGTVLLPGLMIYIVYTLMGTFLADRFTAQADADMRIYVQHMPASLADAFAEQPATLIDADGMDGAALRARVAAGDDAAAYVVFPADFDAAVAAYDVASGEPAPNVAIYYNSASVDSSGAQALVAGVLDGYEQRLANRFDVNAGAGPYDLATESDATGMVFSMLVPMLMLMFVFSGCMAVAPESIAGEKERGTIATLLVTPVRRSELAIGKIVSLSVAALLSGLSSFAGTMLSMPKLMGLSSDQLSAAAYGVREYALLLAVVLSTVLLVIALISIISAAARSVKEAGTTVSPLMLLVILVGITSMLGGGAPQQPLLYLIPLYNSVQAMSAILAFAADPLCIALTVASNVLYAAFGAWVLTRMFNSEKIMFSR